MTRLGLMAALGLISTAAGAQDLPVYDPVAPFKVIGGAGKTLVIETDAGPFLCGYVRDAVAAVIEECVPIVSSARISGRDTTNASPTPEDAIAGLTGTAIEAQVRAVFEENGCRLDVSDERATDRMILGHFQMFLGLSAADMSEVSERLEDMIKPMTRAMVQTGAVVLEDDRKIAVLAECQDPGAAEVALNVLADDLSPIERVSAVAGFAGAIDAVRTALRDHVRCALNLGEDAALLDAVSARLGLSGEEAGRARPFLDLAVQKILTDLSDAGEVAIDLAEGRVRLASCGPDTPAMPEATPAPDLEAQVRAFEAAVETLGRLTVEARVAEALAVLPDVFEALGDRCRLDFAKMAAAGGERWLTTGTYTRALKRLGIDGLAAAILIDIATGLDDDSAIRDFQARLADGPAGLSERMDAAGETAEEVMGAFDEGMKTALQQPGVVEMSDTSATLIGCD